MEKFQFRNYKAQYLQMLIQYYEHNLTEYLKLLSRKNLENVLSLLSNDDLIGSRGDIYLCIKDELEYRDSDKKLTYKKR